MKVLKEYALVIVMTIALIAVVHVLVGRMYVVPSGSMEPTLHGCPGCQGDRIVAEKISYYFSEPQPGDVVVFDAPESWHNEPAPWSVVKALGSIGLGPGGDHIMVKRVIAVAGQTVSCKPGDPAIMVDGKATNQEFILQPAAQPVAAASGSENCGGAYFGPIVVPEDRLWVMGDNRTMSADSRFHMGIENGTVPTQNVAGKVTAKIWPLQRIEFGLTEKID
ncbi:signal peptidase I [Corynebacterium sp. H128]|uniref:signal peptidase I n=1 Tax=Corynebacterium sp. H128 TaxID=3133427 RepID=UPI00309B8F94